MKVLLVTQLLVLLHVLSQADGVCIDKDEVTCGHLASLPARACNSRWKSKCPKTCGVCKDEPEPVLVVPDEPVLVVPDEPEPVVVVPVAPDADGCPDGYIKQIGDIGGWGNASIDGVKKFVANREACGKLCSDNDGCLSFEHSNTENYCNLNTKRYPTGDKPYGDYVFCSKRDAPKFVALGAPCTMRVWAQCNADINSQCRKKKMADGTKGKVCACKGKWEVIEDKCVQKCDAGKKRVEGKCVVKA